MNDLDLNERELRAMCGCFFHMAMWARIPVIGIEDAFLSEEEKDALERHLREFLFPEVPIPRPIRVTT